MAHINHSRDVYQRNRLSLSSFLTLDNSNPSFAAFCGRPAQRNAVALHGIRRYWGRTGIVLLHNDASLENSLGQLETTNPQLKTYLVNHPGNVDFYYDPLYGLSAEHIVNCIIPLASGNSFSDTNRTVRSYLACYLEIMNIQFRMNPQPFGNYPYNLDLLMELVRMPYRTLEQSVLNHLPEPQREHIKTLLSTPNAQQSVYDAVTAFATIMRTYIWTSRGFAGHSRMSITQAVRERCLISIYVSDSNPELLDYLTTELYSLINQQIPFLLMESGIQLNNCARLKQLFFAEHQHSNYSTAIITDGLSGIINSEEEMATLFSQHPEFIVFSCNNVRAAEPFSNALGTYQRLIEETQYSRNREPFHIFASHGNGRATREVTEHNVRPEELVYLNDGCLLCSTHYRRPVLIRHFSL